VKKKKQVTAALIKKGDRILLAQRKAGDRLGGKWEFPGGTIEPGETPEECLARELLEEFEITVEVGVFVAGNTFDYGDIIIELLGYETEYLRGEFKLLEHDQIHWVPVENILTYDLAEADIPIAKEMIRRSQ